MSDAKTFDPGRYLTKVGSADYLEVKWRLVWLREVHPDALIETEIVSHSDQMAIFKARISIPGGGSASGYGSEGYNDFRDYIEKAETKAIGRACAALGFGTQFCPDFDFANGAAQGRTPLVDSPTDFAGTRGAHPHQLAPQARTNGHSGTPANGNGQRPTIQNPGAPASDKQLNFIRSLAKDLGYKIVGPDGSDHTDENALIAVVGADFKADWPTIDKQTASEIIESFQAQIRQTGAVR